jgi:hypothetical protein
MMMPSMMNNMAAFHVHAVVALNLIARVSGVLLLNKACQEGFFCKKTGKTLGGLVVVVSILSLLCIGYLSLKRCCHLGEERGAREMGMSLGGSGMGMPKGSLPGGNLPEGWRHPPIDNMPTLPSEPEAKPAPKKK